MNDQLSYIQMIYCLIYRMIRYFIYSMNDPTVDKCTGVDASLHLRVYRDLGGDPVPAVRAILMNHLISDPVTRHL